MTVSNKSQEVLEDSASLEKLTSVYMESSFAELPEELQIRVKEEFFPLLWDDLTHKQRMELVRQLDFFSDPDNYLDLLGGLFDEDDRLSEEIKRWQAVEARTVGEMALQEQKLTELVQQRTAVIEKINNFGKFPITEVHSWSLVKPERFVLYGEALFDYLCTAHESGWPVPSSRQVLLSWKENPPTTLCVEDVDEFCLIYRKADGELKKATLENIDKAIKRMVVFEK